jgi:hypothetical protein
MTWRRAPWPTLAAGYVLAIMEEQIGQGFKKSIPITVAAGIIWVLVALGYRDKGHSVALVTQARPNIPSIPNIPNTSIVPNIPNIPSIPNIPNIPNPHLNIQTPEHQNINCSNPIAYAEILGTSDLKPQIPNLYSKP